MGLWLGIQVSPAQAARVVGAALPEQVTRIGETRFRSLQNWERTVRWFRRVYGDSEGVVWRRLETPPQVEAFMVENLRRGRSWDAIHVYRALRGPHEGVHIFVAPASTSK